MRKLITSLIFMVLLVFMAIPAIAEVPDSAPNVAEVVQLSELASDSAIAANVGAFNVADTVRWLIDSRRMAQTAISTAGSTNYANANASTDVKTRERSGHRSTRHALLCFT